MYISKTVEQFKVGDGIRIYGYEGTVTEVAKETRENGECTYLKVRFNNPKEIGYQYDGGWYGGLNGVVGYGCKIQ